MSARAVNETMDPELAAYLGSPVVVSPILPLRPSPGEQARRLVRHLYAQAREDTGRAALFPDTLGEVGPRPTDPIRAVWMDGTVAVDAATFDKLRELDRKRLERDRKRLERERSRRALERQEQHDLQAIATALGVRRVTAHREHDYFRTLYRAHTEPEGTTWRGGPQVRIGDAEVRRLPNTTAVIAHVAQRLRTAIAEWKLDEEAAARGGDR